VPTHDPVSHVHPFVRRVTRPTDAPGEDIVWARPAPIMLVRASMKASRHKGALWRQQAPNIVIGYWCSVQQGQPREVVTQQPRRRA
jgi:hypothetical protein